MEQRMALALAFLACVLPSLGCELIASVNRDEIPNDSGFGGAVTVVDAAAAGGSANSALDAEVVEASPAQDAENTADGTGIDGADGDVTADSSLAADATEASLEGSTVVDGSDAQRSGDGASGESSPEMGSDAAGAATPEDAAIEGHIDAATDQ